MDRVEQHASDVRLNWHGRASSCLAPENAIYASIFVTSVLYTTFRSLRLMGLCFANGCCTIQYK